METDTPVLDDAVRNAQIVEAMRAEGLNTDESLQDDYFGFEEYHQVYLPDGKSYVQHKALNEGARCQYANAQSRDVTIEKVSGNAKLRMQSGEERRALLSTAICGWNLMRRGQPITFGKSALKEFLDNANPKIIDLIEKDIRKHNPWLMADVTVEDIEKQIAELEELLVSKKKETEGKDD